MVGESASGYIPSNSEKDDPRYKTALTVDIKPGTMQQNAKKLGSTIARDGRPPLMRKGSINVKEAKLEFNMENIDYLDAKQHYIQKRKHIDDATLSETKLESVKFPQQMRFAVMEKFHERMDQDTKDFINLIVSLNSKKTIKVGDMFSVMAFSVVFPLYEVYAEGFMDPKKVANIRILKNGKIDHIEFEDGTIYPRTPNVTVGEKQRPSIYPVYTESYEDAMNALTYVKLALPDGWEMEYHELENMKNIKETTTAGSVATIANPTSKKAGSLFKGTNTREKFINSKEIKEMLNDELGKLTESLDPSYLTSTSIPHYNKNEKIMEDIRIINKLLKSDLTGVDRSKLNRYLKPLYHHMLITRDDHEDKVKKMAKDQILLSSEDNQPVEAFGYYYKNDRKYVFTQVYKNEESARKAAEKYNLTIMELTPKKSKIKENTQKTENFKRWFKNSKVVDKSGQPLVVYHGTEFTFHTFTNASMSFFTQNPHIASAYAENGGRLDADESSPNVMPVYLSIQNPIVLTERDISKICGPINDRDWESLETFLYKIEKNGIYDGAHLVGVYDFVGGKKPEKYDQWVVFKNTQIKSAIGNNGDYSPLPSTIKEALDQVDEKNKK